MDLPPVEVNGFVAAVAVLGFVQGAYMTEVLRGAILAIPTGQIEAAKAFGMGPVLRFRRVLLPALLPNALPGLANLWMSVTKDSALVAVVGYQELRSPLGLPVQAPSITSSSSSPRPFFTSPSRSFPTLPSS